MVHVLCVYIRPIAAIGVILDVFDCGPAPRYTRAEPFTALNVDVRFQRHLFESLEAFVKGDLLEGNNAYQCEKCNKKVCV